MICFSGAEGSSGVAAAAVGAAAIFAAAPLFSPLVQIWVLARKSKEEIEETVRVKAPLQVSSCIKVISQHSRSSAAASKNIPDAFLTSAAPCSDPSNKCDIGY